MTAPRRLPQKCEIRLTRALVLPRRSELNVGHAARVAL